MFLALQANLLYLRYINAQNITMFPVGGGVYTFCTVLTKIRSTELESAVLAFSIG